MNTPPRAVLELRNRHRGSPVLVVGNGVSRRDHPLPLREIPSIGCNGIIYDEEWPDYLVFNTPGFARVAFNRNTARGSKSTILVPTRGDNRFRAEFYGTYTYKRSYDAPVPLRGVFQAGMLGNACVDLARLLGASPVVLAGFDGDTTQLYAQKPFYKLGHAAPWFIQQCHEYLVKSLQESGTPARVLYPHGNLPFEVWKP